MNYENHIVLTTVCYIKDVLSIIFGLLGTCIFYIIGTGLYSEIAGPYSVYARCWDFIGFLMGYLFAFLFFNKTKRLIVVVLFLVLYIGFHFKDLPLGYAPYYQYEYWCSSFSLITGLVVIFYGWKKKTPLYRLVDSHPIIINAVPFLGSIIGLSLHAYLNQFHSHFHDIPTRYCNGNELIYSITGTIGSWSFILFLPLFVLTIFRLVERKFCLKPIK